MKLLTFSLLFVSALSAQSTAVAKPEASVRATPTPLTTEEKLSIRELQLQITQMKHQADVEIPKAISEAQDKINKMVMEMQVRHNAQQATLKYDLQWELPATTTLVEVKK